MEPSRVKWMVAVGALGFLAVVGLVCVFDLDEDIYTVEPSTSRPLLRDRREGLWGDEKLWAAGASAQPRSLISANYYYYYYYDEVENYANTAAEDLINALPDWIKTGTLESLQNEADGSIKIVVDLAFLSITGQPLEGFQENVLSEEFSQKIKGLNNGCGKNTLGWLKKVQQVIKVIEKIYSLLDKNQSKPPQRHLLELTNEEITQKLLNFGETDPGLWYLLAAILSTGGADPGVIRLFEMKGSAVEILLESGFQHTTNVMGDVTEDAKRRRELKLVDVVTPGEILTLLPSPLGNLEATSILTGLQKIALDDDLKYKNLPAAQRKSTLIFHINAMLNDLGITPANPPQDESSAGMVNSGIYMPSDAFREAYGDEVSRATPIDSEDITVSLVAFYDIDGDTPYNTRQTIGVFYTARLQQDRCFVCDRRDQDSSETDSQAKSSAQSSEVSSSQRNFRDSARTSCQRNSQITFGPNTFKIAASQFVYTKSCSNCAQHNDACPNFSSAAEAFSEAAHQKALFTGSSAVERSKEHGSKTRGVDFFDVPNKKVVNENDGHAASSEEFEHVTIQVSHTKIKVPVKGA